MTASRVSGYKHDSFPREWFASVVHHCNSDDLFSFDCSRDESEPANIQPITIQSEALEKENQKNIALVRTALQQRNKLNNELHDGVLTYLAIINSMTRMIAALARET
jgi:signal transduction histidine kinase